MIRPCGHRLLVKAPKQEEVDPVLKAAKEFGFSLINENKKREDASVDVGIVIDIGPTAWKDFHGVPWCKKGDEIIFAKFAGKVVTDPEDMQEYFILNDEDVVAVTKEA